MKKMVLNRKYAILVLVAVMLCSTFTCFAARGSRKPSVLPDFTKGGKPDLRSTWSI